ncbi:MAG: metallophosphoesterase [Thermodesulfobacteriota bacterium]
MTRFLAIALGAFLAAQVLGLIIWRRRLAGRPWLRWAPYFLFLAGNLPWFVFDWAMSQPLPPPSWLIALVIRPFVTWQVGTVLWLAAGSALTILVALFYTLPRRTAELIRKLGQGPVLPEPANPERRRFLIKSAQVAIWSGALATAGWGLVRATQPPRVVRYDLAYPDLPQTLDGLKIAHLSDLHVGLWTTMDEVAQALALARDLNPDLVVVTGDLIDHNPSFSDELVRCLPILARVPLGVFAIIGNHDVYTGAESVTAALHGRGLTMLRNRHHSFLAEGLPLALIGVDDNGRHWTSSGGPLPIAQAGAGLEEDQMRVLLAHRPTSFEQARLARIPLTLCGHTHGGQFALPDGRNLAQFAYEYTHGVYTKKEGLLHVSAGLGAVGLPFRLGVAPEIALLRLVRA